MITRLSHVTVFVEHQDEALKFYTEKLGFEKRMDATFGGFRWVTVAPPRQKELELVLLEPRSMFDAATAKKFEALLREGKLGGGVFCTDDCQKDYEELSARGVNFKGPPEKKPFGIQATLSDNSGNWFSLTQPK
jgi:catechol 2,3-dioxygenase-like lactoylglutathione lyase family enzyme